MHAIFLIFFLIFFFLLFSGLPSQVGGLAFFLELLGFGVTFFGESHEQMSLGLLGRAASGLGNPNRARGLGFRTLFQNLGLALNKKTKNKNKNKKKINKMCF